MSHQRGRRGVVGHDPGRRGLSRQFLHLLRVQRRVGAVHHADQLIDDQCGLHLHLRVLVDGPLDVRGRADERAAALQSRRPGRRGGLRARDDPRQRRGGVDRPRYAASLPPRVPPEGLPLKVFTRLRPFTIVAAVWPNEPRLPQDICPPPRIELRLGALVMEKPLPSAALVIEPVVRLPLTAAWVAVTCVKICWLLLIMAAVFEAVVVAWLNVAASMTGTCAPRLLSNRQGQR